MNQSTAGQRQSGAISYHERLRAPLIWWVLGAGFAGSVLIAYQHGLGAQVALPVTALTMSVIAAGILGYGRVRVRVSSTGFAAGRAMLPAWAIGEVAALDAAAARAARGPDLDVRAYTLIRGYIATAVKITVADDADPVPYWLVSTRHPERLAEALISARAGAVEQQGMP